jgi:hypothetical protein
VHRRAVLSCWQQTWEPLPEPLRERFLARPQVDELTSIPDETARMSIRAHAKLDVAILHARWLSAGRPSPAACGCKFYEGPDAGVHKLFIIPGPDTRVGGRGPSSTTVLGRCRCGWERRGASGELVRADWEWHRRGEDEEPVEEY